MFFDILSYILFSLPIAATPFFFRLLTAPLTLLRRFSFELRRLRYHAAIIIDILR